MPGAFFACCSCMGWGPDKEGVNGIYLEKWIVDEAGKAMEQVLRISAPKIITWRQYAEAAVNLVSR